MFCIFKKISGLAATALCIFVLIAASTAVNATGPIPPIEIIVIEPTNENVDPIGATIRIEKGLFSSAVGRIELYKSDTIAAEKVLNLALGSRWIEETLMTINESEFRNMLNDAAIGFFAQRLYVTGIFLNDGSEYVSNTWLYWKKDGGKIQRIGETEFLTATSRSDVRVYSPDNAPDTQNSESVRVGTEAKRRPYYYRLQSPPPTQNDSDRITQQRDLDTNN